MKHKRSPFFLFLLSFLMVGCVKDMYDPSEKIPGNGTNPFSVAGVRVPAGFEWSMIETKRLAVEPYDAYEGKYAYLVEVYDREPTEPDASLLTTGIVNRDIPFSKQLVYPKGNTDRVYLKLITPTGYPVVCPVDLKSNDETLCVVDSATVCADLSGTPQSRSVEKNPVSLYTLLIEDSFPEYGDYDFNDIVVGVRMETIRKEDYVEKVSLSLEFRAVGATKKAGFYLRLPTVDPGKIKQVQLNNWGVTSEFGDDPVYAVSDDLHALFSYHGELINTEDKNPYRGSVTRQVDVLFKPGEVKDFTIADLDLFSTTLKQEGERFRTEIHMRNFTYTAKGLRYRYYSDDHCVWALLVPGRILYPKEHAFIGKSHPSILKWAGGDANQVCWYRQGKDDFLYLLEK